MKTIKPPVFTDENITEAIPRSELAQALTVACLAAIQQEPETAAVSVRLMATYDGNALRVCAKIKTKIPVQPGDGQAKASKTIESDDMETFAVIAKDPNQTEIFDKADETA